MPENDSTVTYDPDRIDCDTVGADERGALRRRQQTHGVAHEGRPTRVTSFVVNFIQILFANERIVDSIETPAAAGP